MVLLAVLPKSGSRIWLLPFLFSIGATWMWALVNHAPILYGMDPKEVGRRLSFPSSLDELRSLADVLQMYRDQYWLFTLILFCSAYLFKQAFSVPGSVFLNVLAGALYGGLEGWLLCCVLSAVGASLCYQLSYTCCRELVARLFPERIQQLTSKVNSNRHQMLYFLLFVRLFPMTPNWFVNVASPIVGVPLSLFSLSVLFGLMPYNLVCAQAGSLLGSLRSMDDLFTPWTLCRLMLIALAALLPSIYQKVRRNSTPLYGTVWRQRAGRSL